MEPAKPARVESRVRTQLRNWLQYGEELGLGPYYRDRRVTAEIAGAFPSDETASTENPELNGRSASASPRILEKTSPMPPTKILKNSASSLISPAHAENLFGDPFRVANDSLPKIREDIGDCTRCKLSKGRTKIVFGTGNPNAQLDRKSVV